MVNPSSLGRLLGGVVAALAVVALSVAALLFALHRLGTAKAGETASTEAGGVQRLDADTLSVPPEVIRSLNVRTAPVVAAPRFRPLPPLAGCLALENNRLSRVHSLFAGDVVELGKVAADGGRSLGRGDVVKKGDLLAVIRSKDLGEKKSELVDALSRLKLDRDTLTKLQALAKLQTAGSAAGSERSLREAERAVEADRIAVNRAQLTLLSWQLTEDDLEAVRAEADHPPATTTENLALAERWARVEVRARQDGTILEQNVSVGTLVDPSTELFKIGDLTRLAVWAHVYEEDLPAVGQRLKQSGPVPWVVRVGNSTAAYPGYLEQVGELIDPLQHTALVTGTIDNPRGQFRVGQYVTVQLELPAAEAEVEVPTAALVEDGRTSVVFVQPDPEKAVFVRRPVSVARRGRDVSYVSTAPPQVIRPGERVVTGGAVFFQEALADLPLTAAE
jgi:membrane fusion protein, heavy metal efflux system